MTALPEASAGAGLSDKEAAGRLRSNGYNELPAAQSRRFLTLAWEVVHEPMFLLLVACGLVYLLLGDIHEALMLLGFVFVVIGITIYQEHRAERAIEALRDLTSPRALVIRGGERKRIPGREVVVGDVLLLSEGDRVPADAFVITCINLTVDESLLTGESAPVKKTACADGYRPAELKRPGGESAEYVFSGTLVVQGQGIAQVIATGEQTEIGRIGKSLVSIETEETLLQKETGRLVRKLAGIGLSLCAVVAVVYGVTRGDWLHGLLAGITLAMATLPEEFPVVLTIFLAIGAWRISRHRVLTRRVPVVETLGACTVLCVDKTGTLTTNSMTVRKIYAGGRSYEVSGADRDADRLPEEFHEILEFGILASKADPFDPMEKALRSLGGRTLVNTEHLHEDWRLIREYPLSDGLLALSHVWKSEDSGNLVIASKGAPEAICDLCHLDVAAWKQISAQAAEMAEEGLRVIGVARSETSTDRLPGIQHEFSFAFLGLIGLEDPIRQSVPGAIRECSEAGIRVTMITGDHPGTAVRIGEKLGLDAESCVTGPELEQMDDTELARRISSVSIFARVVPEQKLRIVNALKANGEVVAMTGDGVNDAPALKSAHIGIAMGGRGTDVAREASDLVLLDDEFSSIVQAVRMGRRIFDNLKKATAYIFAIHVPVIGLSLLPVLLGLPLILLPVHVVLLELIIDPACSIVFEAEAEEKDIMRRKPRNPRVPLFGGRSIGISVLQGMSVLLISFAVFLFAHFRGNGIDDARALTVTTLVVANLGLIFSNRSWTRTIVETLRLRNPALWWVTGGTALGMGFILGFPLLRDLFHFSTLHPVDYTICIGAGIISVLWFEALKVIGRKKTRVPA